MFLNKLIIWGVLLLIFIGSMTVTLFKTIYRDIRKNRSEEIFNSKCLKCGSLKQINIVDLMKISFFIKTSTNKGDSFSKKMHCDVCSKKTMHEILDYHDIASKNMKIILPLIVNYFFVIIVVGIMFLLVGKYFVF